MDTRCCCPVVIIKRIKRKVNGGVDVITKRDILDIYFSGLAVDSSDEDDHHNCSRQCVKMRFVPRGEGQKMCFKLSSHLRNCPAMDRRCSSMATDDHLIGEQHQQKECS